jgi:hypothetical protein
MFQTEQIEKIVTHILWSIFFFFENRAVYEMWENIVQPDKQQYNTAHKLYDLRTG